MKTDVLVQPLHLAHGNVGVELVGQGLWCSSNSMPLKKSHGENPTREAITPLRPNQHNISPKFVSSLPASMRFFDVPGTRTFSNQSMGRSLVMPSKRSSSVGCRPPWNVGACFVEVARVHWQCPSQLHFCPMYRLVVGSITKLLRVLGTFSSAGSQSSSTVSPNSRTLAMSSSRSFVR